MKNLEFGKLYKFKSKFCLYGLDITPIIEPKNNTEISKIFNNDLIILLKKDEKKQI